MRKFLSLILSLLLIFSAFSVTAFADFDTPKAETTIENIDFEKGVSILFSTFSASDFPDSVLYIKGEMLAMETSVEGINVKLIIKNNLLYIYFADFPFFYYKEENIDISEYTAIFENINMDAEFSKNYQETLDGITYDIEEYITADGELLRYYIFEGNLKYAEIISKANDEYSHIKLEILSTELDNSIFEPPFFSFDITPILDFFINLVF